ncbi:hypothetical protein Tco_0873277 [Tanacetum coccineum]
MSIITQSSTQIAIASAGRKRKKCLNLKIPECIRSRVAKIGGTGNGSDWVEPKHILFKIYIMVVRHLTSSQEVKCSNLTTYTFGLARELKGRKRSRDTLVRTCTFEPEDLPSPGFQPEDLDYRPIPSVLRMVVKMLPRRSIKLSGVMRMAYDPIKSPPYKVMHAGETGVDDVPWSFVQIQTYSSETGK